MKRFLYREDGKRRAVTNSIVVIANILMWVVMEWMGDTTSGEFILQHGGIYPPLLAEGEWWRLFTAMFIHFGLEHLVNNMLILAVTGDKLENTVGPFFYLLIYIGSGLGGNLLSLYEMQKKGESAICAGASGAVFGVVGALLWLAIRNRGKIEGLTTKGLLLMIALCMYYGISTAGVDNWAHAGGAICGFFLCMLEIKLKSLYTIIDKR